MIVVVVMVMVVTGLGRCGFDGRTHGALGRQEGVHVAWRADGRAEQQVVETVGAAADALYRFGSADAGELAALSVARRRMSG